MMGCAWCGHYAQVWGLWVYEIWYTPMTGMMFIMRPMIGEWDGDYGGLNNL